MPNEKDIIRMSQFYEEQKTILETEKFYKSDYL